MLVQERCSKKKTYLNVSSIIVNSTNFPNNGTTNEVGGIISANSKKNTVSESKIDMLNETWNERKETFLFVWETKRRMTHKNVCIYTHVHIMIIMVVVVLKVALYLTFFKNDV